MDFRELLMKYIAHVGACEGVTFIFARGRDKNKNITPEEWDELETMDAESRKYS